MTHHAHHHHHHRRWTWAHVQQSLRRNCLMGPVAFCLLVILAAPYLMLEDSWEANLPRVQAVPFFRQAKAVAFRTRRAVVTSITGGAAAGPLGASAAVAEPLTVPVEEETATVEEASTTITTQATTTTPTAAPATTTAKRKHRDTTTEYNFPLVSNPEQFQQDESSPIPFRYYEAHQRNDDVARKAVLGSLQWREDKQIDTILSRPHPNYDVAKRVLPHYFIGRSAVTNHVVFVQRPGLANLPLGSHNGLGLKDMLHQYAYVFEYCWNVLHTNTQTTMEGDNDLMIGIMDLQGVNLSVLRKSDLIQFIKEFVGMIDAHYPTRAYKTYMVNAPGWFSTLMKLISPIMRETTKEKLVLFSAGAAQNAALEQALGKDMADTLQQALRIPTKQERKSKAKNDIAMTSDILLETEMEQEIRNFVVQRLDADGLKMKETVPLDS